jgi:hypothetical protein
MVEAVVHPLPVLPYVSRAIPSMLAPTGPSLAAPPAPFPSAAATAGSIEVPPSASASTHANLLLRLIDSDSPRLCTRTRERPNRRAILPGSGSGRPCKAWRVST